MRTIVVWKRQYSSPSAITKPLRENHSGMETPNLYCSIYGIIELRENHSGMETLCGVTPILQVLLVA